MTIYDRVGALVYQTQVTGTSWNAEDLELQKGLYMVRIKSYGVDKTVRMIVQ